MPKSPSLTLAPARRQRHLHHTLLADGRRGRREAARKKPHPQRSSAVDHQHQRGLWFAHDNVNKLDFWNNEWSYFADLHRKNLGRINLVEKLGDVKSGKDKGSIAATFEWTDMEGKTPSSRESRVMTFYADPKLRYFDVDITLTAIVPVTFGDGKDGAFGIRLRPVLQEDKGDSHITNAEGLVGEKQLWGKPSQLVRLFGRDQR